MHISVTIPVFNRAHLVIDTLKSVLGQDFDDFDVVVVDDASTDKTVEEVQKICDQDPRVKLFINSQNLGLTRNWNRCIELAKGPLIQIMLSDDLMDNDYLTVVSDLFENKQNVGFVASSCRYIDAQGKEINPGSPIPPRLYKAGDEAVTALLTGGFPHVSSIVIHKKCFDELGKYDERIWHGPDVEMDARLASGFDFYHFGEVHTSFRRHGSNMGSLEYLRKDFLEVDMLKKRLAWAYLTQAGREKLGVYDLDKYISSNAARAAVTGAIVTVAFGQPKLSRFYLKKSFLLDHSIWHNPQFFKSLILVIFPHIGKKIMERRMKMNEIDHSTIETVEKSLNSL